MDLSIFFNLNPCFPENFKLITNSITLLFNNTSIITSFYISLLSNPIFTITSLNNSFFSVFLTSTNSYFFSFLSFFNFSSLKTIFLSFLLLGLSKFGILTYIPSIQIIPVLNFPSLAHYTSISTISCKIAKFSITIAIPSLVHIHYIRISSYFFFFFSLSLQRVSNYYCICSFDLFY